MEVDEVEGMPPLTSTWGVGAAAARVNRVGRSAEASTDDKTAYKQVGGEQPQPLLLRISDAEASLCKDIADITQLTGTIDRAQLFIDENIAYVGNDHAKQ